MFQNYIKIAFRNLVKNRSYSAINIGGLAVGMAVAMLIGLWIYDELSFNRNHKHHDRIAKIMQNEKIHGEIKTSTSLPVPLVSELKANYADHFKYIVTSTHNSEHVFSVGEKKLSRTGQFMDKEAPEMLSLKMIKGSRNGLEDQQGLLVSESTANALFGTENPINKSVLIDTDKNLKITGVYADIPQNSEFYQLAFVGSWDYFLAKNPYMQHKKWDNHALWMYVQISDDTDFAKATASIKDSQLHAIRNMDDMKEEFATNPQLWLHPMKNWHLYSHFENGAAGDGPVQYVRMVGLIGFFVLLLACINFVNLSTARSEKRAKEVGVRKAIGSHRGQLIRQFFTESFLVVLIAFGIAFVLMIVSLPAFCELAAKQIVIPWSSTGFWLANFVFILFTGFLAGSYPALYLTSFQAVRVLKAGAGGVQTGRFAFLPRKILVVLQFTVSITLIIGTVIVYRQIQFAKNRPVGYNRDGLLMIPMNSDEFNGKTEVLKTALKNTGVVSHVAESQSPVTGVWSSNEGFRWNGKGNTGSENFATLTVSTEYAETVGWKFVQGRNFSSAFASDSSGFVINEAAARLMGFAQPVGQTVHWRSKWMTNDVEKHFTVLGVVKDIVMQSPFDPIKPTVFFIFGSPNWINIKIKPNVSSADAISKIEAVFNELMPSALFEYKFADQEYDAKFRAEERIGKLTSLFSALAVFISCLGLFGLASFVAEQRTKEIGIRKVLGASVANLWQMLSKDFVLLVIISCLVSVPIAGYAMGTWLEKYQYRTEISWWIFVSAGVGAVVITLLTVSYQAIKAALTDPVKSLRSDH